MGSKTLSSRLPHLRTESATNDAYSPAQHVFAPTALAGIRIIYMRHTARRTKIDSPEASLISQIFTDPHPENAMRIFLAVMLLSCISFAQNDADAAIAKAKAACCPDDLSFQRQNQ
jgi:hypothetical protein